VKAVAQYFVLNDFPRLDDDVAHPNNLPITVCTASMLASEKAGYVVWLTGLSGSGKTTLSKALASALQQHGHHTLILDGDELRAGLCRDLGFSPQGRAENIRRAAEVAALAARAGLIVLVACISPLRIDRDHARQIVGPDRFTEVWLDCPLSVCEQREVKGLYHQARCGAIPCFTGISAPYEPPAQADLVLQTDRLSLGDCVFGLLKQLGVIDHA
jgi:adenylyl-sulfate kinase